MSEEERRISERVPVSWDVDYATEDTFLFASIANISELGIFVKTREPLEPGTRLRLTFRAPGQEMPYELLGVVQWTNPVRPLSDNRNPGMGIAFAELTPSDRRRLVNLVRTIAYVRETEN